MPRLADELRAAERQLRTNDPALAKVIRAVGPCTITRHRHHYRTLVSSIVSQQLSGKAAETIFNRFASLFGDAFPEPRLVLEVTPERLRACGLSNGKVGFIRDLSARIADGRLDLPRIAKLSDEKLIEELTEVKGIGTWSAHMFMMFSLARLDVLPTGDLGIRKGFQKVYNLRAQPDHNRMETIARKNSWAPYRSVASWYLWRALDE